MNDNIQYKIFKYYNNDFVNDMIKCIKKIEYNLCIFAEHNNLNYNNNELMNYYNSLDTFVMNRSNIINNPYYHKFNNKINTIMNLNQDIFTFIKNNNDYDNEYIIDIFRLLYCFGLIIIITSNKTQESFDKYIDELKFNFFVGTVIRAYILNILNINLPDNIKIIKIHWKDKNIVINDLINKYKNNFTIMNSN